jgi:2-amino-4-hydroxy-6-hydroxymethyldihydropteridine diphosphokinase
VYIGVGSNLGRRGEHIRHGLEMLKQRGFRIVRQSRTYKTRPVAMPGARDFLNLVVAADTRLSPSACLTEFRTVESARGRGQHRRNAPRTLDLDLLLYGRQVIRRPGLMVPHPRMHERMFVLRPLADIAPGVVHPVLRRRVRTLMKPLAGRDQWKAR